MGPWPRSESTASPPPQRCEGFFFGSRCEIASHLDHGWQANSSIRYRILLEGGGRRTLCSRIASWLQAGGREGEREGGKERRQVGKRSQTAPASPRATQKLWEPLVEVARHFCVSDPISLHRPGPQGDPLPPPPHNSTYVHTDIPPNVQIDWPPLPSSARLVMSCGTLSGRT